MRIKMRARMRIVIAETYGDVDDDADGDDDDYTDEARSGFCLEDVQLGRT